MNSITGNLANIDTASVSSRSGFGPAGGRPVNGSAGNRSESVPGEASSRTAELQVSQRARVHFVEGGMAPANLSAQLMEEARSRIFRSYREISRMSIS